MKRQLPAIIAAALITLCVALAMSAVGVDAMLNQNGVDVSNSPSQPASAPASAGNGQDQVQQLQARVAQYQQREAQYQQMLQSDRQQLEQAQFQLQQYQRLLFALQDQGLIRIDSDGRISITGRPDD